MLATGSEPTIVDDFVHQAELLEATWERRGFAIFWQMGVGKTRPTIRSVSRLWKHDRTSGVIVVAPDGVHRNWISDELPRHCDVPWIGLDWHSSASKSKEQRAAFDKLLAAPDTMLACLSITYDGLKTDAGIAAARAFAARRKRFTKITDEAARVKNPTAERSKVCQRIANAAAYVRILNGTPVANSPLDLYGQMLLLDPLYWRKLGIGSFTAFENLFAIKRKIVIAAPEDPTQGRVAPATDDAPASQQMMTLTDKAAQMSAAAAFEEALGDYSAGEDDSNAVPELAGDRDERRAAAVHEHAKKASRGITREIVVGYKDIDKLRAMIEPHSSRLTKEDAGLNLPEKLYQRIPFELAPEQRRAYDTLKRTYMLEVDGELITAAIAMVRILRLQQIACGYLPNPNDPDAEPIAIPGDGNDPRLLHTLELLEDVPGKAIVWARFRRDIDRLVQKLGPACVRYDGAVTSRGDRAKAIDDFRGTDRARFFVANAAAIGMGVTLVEATTTVYYSNDFNLVNRLQSEDRNHRIGQRCNVTYFDLVALRTVDERIVRALVEKKRISDEVVGDAYRAWLT